MKSESITITAKRETYLHQLKNGNIHGTNMEILDLLSRDRRMTKDDIMERTGRKHQSITASLSNLQDLGLVYGVKLVKEKHRSLTVYAFTRDPQLQLDLSRKRHLEKFDQWLKRGQEEFAHFIPKQVQIALFGSMVTIKDDHYINEDSMPRPKEPEPPKPEEPKDKEGKGTTHFLTDLFGDFFTPGK